MKLQWVRDTIPKIGRMDRGVRYHEFYSARNKMLRMLGLLIMGATIAYLGDRIGTKIGKKRMSILGLRPKFTAVIMTIITGMVITITTLYISSLLNPNVRLALFEDIQMIKVKNDELAQMYEDLNNKKAELEGTLKEISVSMESLNTEKERLLKDQESTIKAVSTLRDEKTRLNEELAQRLMESQSLRDQIKKQGEEATALKKNIASLEKEKEEFQKKQMALIEERQNYEKMMEDLKAQKDTLVSQLNSALEEKISLKQAKENLEKSIQEEVKQKESNQKLLSELKKDLELTKKVKSELEQSVANSLADIQGQEQVLSQLKFELTQLDEQMDGLREEKQRAQQEISSLRESLQSKKQSRLVLNSMEPLLNQPYQINEFLNRAQFEKVFQGIVEQLRTNLTRRSIASTIFEENRLKEFENAIYSQYLTLWNEILDARLYLDNPPKGVLIYPVSVNNLMAGETLGEVKFIVSLNRLLILKDKEIAQTRLDPEEEAEKLMKQLIETDDELKKRMFAQGVLGNRFRPRPPSQILQFAEVVDQMKAKSQAGGDFYISIVAEGDIYSHGNFDFRYVIRDEKDYLEMMERVRKSNLSPEEKFRERLEEFKKKYHSSPVTGATTPVLDDSTGPESAQ